MKNAAIFSIKRSADNYTDNYQDSRLNKYGSQKNEKKWMQDESMNLYGKKHDFNGAMFLGVSFDKTCYVLFCVSVNNCR